MPQPSQNRQPYQIPIPWALQLPCVPNSTIEQEHYVNDFELSVPV